ncbi:MAG: DNA replication and repair protein RecF [Puniceicoccales bacterium]|jgi:DNA replication and repair protein RecF|nr:DNA replication and repair protein RecF [Puniceicoccales bacterium]
MKLKILRLEYYRNIAFAELVFDSRCVFFSGSNGQGKSNILESMGLLTALRSFRGHALPLLIQQGKDRAQLYFEGQHDTEETFRLRMKFRPEGKQLWCNEEYISRSTDWIGLYPVIVFSNRNKMWIHGGPKDRRQFFDILLSQLDTSYLRSLKNYYISLKHRNAALKQSQFHILSSFESILAKEAVAIAEKRQKWSSIFNEYFISWYKKISQKDIEQPNLQYEYDTESALLASEDFWLQSREKDKLWQTTQHGIHRDEYLLQLQGNAVRLFASEGQQENIVLAMNFAQMELIKSIKKETPLILLDDVGSELDPLRRERLWNAIPHECQIFACGTQFPKELCEKNWQHWHIHEGICSLENAVKIRQQKER